MVANILALHDSSGMYGAERVILSLGTALGTKRYNMVVGCLMNSAAEKPELGKEAERQGIEVEYFRMNGRFDPFVIRRITSSLRKLNIRLIHSQGYKSNFLGLVAAKLCRIPIMTTNHLFPPMPLNDRKLQMYSRFDSFFAMRHLNVIVAVSDDIKRRLIQKGVNGSKIVVIENGIDLGSDQIDPGFDRQAYKQSLGIDRDALVVGTLGRLTVQKAHVLLIEAAQKVRATNLPVAFLIAGDGFLKEQLEAYARELKVAETVKLVGFRQDTVKLLDIMDVFVLSSIDEGLPMAMLEAMAREVPVVSTRVGDIPKVIKDRENGILLEPGNSDVLAEKMIELLKNPSLRSEIAAKGLSTVKEHYSKEAMGEKYMEIYDRLIFSR